MKRRVLFTITVLMSAGLTSTVVRAFQIAPPGTEGKLIIVAGAAPVVATYQGNSATFSNDLYLMLDTAGNPGDDGDLTNDRFVFNNNAQVSCYSSAALEIRSPGRGSERAPQAAAPTQAADVIGRRPAGSCAVVVAPPPGAVLMSPDRGATR